MSFVSESMIKTHKRSRYAFLFLIKVATRIPAAKLKIPGKAFLKSEYRTSVTFKL